jgi:hypothetical protein
MRQHLGRVLQLANAKAAGIGHDDDSYPRACEASKVAKNKLDAHLKELREKRERADG